MKLSIIIPLFNVEAYISRCLDSIYISNISESEFEIIAVDDGSTDKSAEVIQSYQNFHCNIKLIRKENGGVSSARNIAISHAEGDYCIFVDPDDVLIKQALDLLIEKLQDSTLDSFATMRSYNETDKELYKWNFTPSASYDCIETINKNYVRGSVCGCVFSRAFLIKNNLLFPLGIRNSEDTIFFFNCMDASRCMIFWDIPFYKVIGREGSASRTFSKERILKNIDSLHLVQQYIDASKNNPYSLDLMNFLKFILILNTLTTAIETENCSLAYLKSLGVNKLNKVKCKNIKYKKIQMILLSYFFSFSYYILRFRHFYL